VTENEPKLQWWEISAGTPDGSAGEREGRIRASSKERAAELYLMNRPSTWEIFEIKPGTAPVIRPEPEGVIRL
jgi:hypothetical protein